MPRRDDRTFEAHNCEWYADHMYEWEKSELMNHPELSLIFADEPERITLVVGSLDDYLFEAFCDGISIKREDARFLDRDAVLTHQKERYIIERLTDATPTGLPPAPRHTIIDAPEVDHC